MAGELREPLSEPSVAPSRRFLLAGRYPTRLSVPGWGTALHAAQEPAPALVTAAESTSHSVAVRGHAREQHEDRSNDANDRRQPQRDAYGPHKRCKQHRDQNPD